MKCTSGLLAGSFVACLLAAGCGGSSNADRAPTVPAAPAAAAKPAPASPRETRDALELLSVLSVEREVDLSAERDGVVVEVVKDAGSRVAKGDVLARLDDRALVAQRDRARADLEVARNNVKYNEAEVKARQAGLRRQQELRTSGLSSDADLEEAEFKAKGAEYDLESWRAVVERNQATLRELDLEVDQMRLRAPFSGVVAQRFIRVGQNVAKDQKCFRLSQLGPLLVRFQVPENSPRRPRVGDAVSLSLASNSQPVYSARIQQVSPIVDPASGSYDVSAQLTGRNLAELRPGMAVHVLWQPAAAAPKR
jgi:RND family efflux transporter MFP subunit